MRTSELMTVRQRRTDLFVGLTFQVVGLFAVSELLHGEYPLPLVAISVSAYGAASLASLYVMIVTEFRPVAFETASFSLWMLTNAAFAYSIHTAHMPKVDNTEHRERMPAAAMHFPDDAVRSPANERQLNRIKEAWPKLSDESKQRILDIAAPEKKDDAKADKMEALKVD